MKQKNRKFMSKDWNFHVSSERFPFSRGRIQNPILCSSLWPLASACDPFHDFWRFTNCVAYSYNPTRTSHTKMVRYGTIRWTILTCAQKLTSSQFNLPHGTTQKSNEETENKQEGQHPLTGQRAAKVR